MNDKDDLFELIGITPNGTAEDADDLFGGVLPTASATNKAVFDNMVDIDDFRKTASLVDERVNELKQQQDKEKHSFTGALSELSRDDNGDVVVQWYNPASWIGSAAAGYHKTIDDHIKFLEQNKQMVSNLITPERFSELQEKGAIGIFESAKRSIKWGNAPFIGNFVEGYQKGKISELMEKIKNNEELTAEENATVKEYLMDGIETTIRGSSIGGRIVDGLASMPAFMIEYGVAKGLLGATTKAASATAAGAKVLNFADKVAKTGKVGAVTVKTSKVVGTAAGRALFMPGQVYNNYNDIRLNSAYNLSENGQILFNDNQDKPATMVLKAFGLTTITALSEDSGEAITGLVKKGVSPIYNRLPPKVRNGIVKLARQTEKYKNTPISKLFEAGGYSNVLGEIGEERLEDLLGAITGLNPQGDSYFDSIGNALMPGWDQFLVEAGVISIAGGARSGLNYLYAKGFNPTVLKGLSTAEQDKVVEREVKKDVGNLSPKYQTYALPVDSIFLSPDIPNFKEGANENGVVAGEELQGTYDELGTAPIVVWQRENGRLEIITGRHRLDLAKRNNMATIPAHIVKEADGFTAQQARMLDVEQNIKDEKGTVRDYARYFMEGKISEEDAQSKGLLSRAKGRRAFTIANKATSGLYSLFINNKISDLKAEAIANGAPNNEAAQNAGIKAAEKMSAEELQAYTALLSQAKPKQSSNGDLFGYDNSAVNEAEAIAKLVAKDKKEIDAKISAVRGALKNPELAKKMGLSFKATPETIGKEVNKLLFQKQQLENFYTDSKLMTHYRGLLQGNKESVFDVLPDNVPADFMADKSSEDAQAQTEKTDTEKENKNEPEEVELNDDESFWELANRKWFDDIAPLQKLALDERAELTDGKRPDLLARAYQYSARMIEKNISDETYYIDDNGNEVVTGEGLKPLLKDFLATMHNIEPSKSKAMQDFNDFLVARRYLQDLDEMEDVEVTEDQRKQSAADIVRLNDKYGEDFELFEDFSNRIYNFQKRILQNLVKSGNLSQEQFDDITEKHKHYVPFKRVMEDKAITGIGSRGIFDETRTSKVLKKIKGSERDVKDIFVSIANNAAKTLDLAYRNRIARSVADLKDFMPEYIKAKKPIYEHGVAKTKVAYDARFRQQLEKAVKFFGGKVEYMKSLERAKGEGLIMGSYTDSEKTIRKRLGSQDRTLAHEFGHMLDYVFGLKEDFAKNPVIMQEISKLAEDRFYPVIGLDANKKGEIEFKENITNKLPQAYIDYVKSPREAIANALDLYFSSKDYMKKSAPQTYKTLEHIFDMPATRFLKTIRPSSATALEEIETDVFMPSKQKPFGNVIEYYENGKKKYVEVAKPIYEAMHKLSPIQLGFVSKFLSFAGAPAKLLRWGATTTPNFIIRNFIKDQFTAYVQTKDGMRTTPLQTIKALSQIIGKGKLYREWERSGGAGGGYYDWSEKGANQYLEELKNPKGRFFRTLKAIEDTGWKDWRRYANIALSPATAIVKGWNTAIGVPSQAIEEATRLGAFAKAKQAGLSDLAAAIESRESTVDFGRGGEVSRLINRLVPFFNVGLQSANKLYRTAKSNPTAFMFNSLATIAFPSIAITGYYLYGAPDEERERWLETPDYVRDNNWCFFYNGELVTFPKPFTVGYMGTAFEDFMIWGYKGKKPEARKWWDVVSGMIGSMSPVQTGGSLLTPVGQVAIEAMTNYNFFRERPIYPKWLEDLPPEERKNKTTSKLGIYIGEKTGMSPAIVDNTIYGLTSTVGKQAIGFAEGMLDRFKRWNGEKVPEKTIILKDIPFVGALFGNLPDGTRSKSYQQFMKDYRKFLQVNTAYKQRSGVDKAKYGQQHAFEIEAFKGVKKKQKEIRNIQKEISRIYDDPRMTAKAKTKAVTELELSITRKAQEANEQTAAIKKTYEKNKK